MLPGRFAFTFFRVLLSLVPKLNPPPPPREADEVDFANPGVAEPNCPPPPPPNGPAPPPAPAPKLRAPDEEGVPPRDGVEDEKLFACPKAGGPLREPLLLCWPNPPDTLGWPNKGVEEGAPELAPLPNEKVDDDIDDGAPLPNAATPPFAAPPNIALLLDGPETVVEEEEPELPKIPGPLAGRGLPPDWPKVNVVEELAPLLNPPNEEDPKEEAEGGSVLSDTSPEAYPMSIVDPGESTP